MSKSTNSIFCIKPYRWSGIWVFDDDCVGLFREAFVAGADTVIDIATKDIPDAEKGFVLLFSSTAFPGHQVRLDKVEGEVGLGTTYWSEQLGQTALLCPALQKYFPASPESIYAQFKPQNPKTPILDYKYYL